LHGVIVYCTRGFICHLSPTVFFSEKEYSSQKVKNNVNIGPNMSYRTGHVYRKKETRDGRNEGRKEGVENERKFGRRKQKIKKKRYARSAEKEIISRYMHTAQ
jgi:hypothetical protein